MFSSTSLVADRVPRLAQLRAVLISKHEGALRGVQSLCAEPEVRAEDAYEWTQGRAVFADRKRRDPSSGKITLSDGHEFQPSARRASMSQLHKSTWWPDMYRMPF